MAENSRRAVEARVIKLGMTLDKIEQGWGITHQGETVAFPTSRGMSMPEYWEHIHQTLDTFTAPEPASKETTPSLDVPLPDAGSFFEEDDGFVPPPTMTSGVGDLQPAPPQKGFTKMTTSGFCKWPGVENQGHTLCQKNNPHPCDCACHLEEEDND